MHPVLFKFGSITLYTYGLFVALGFLAAVTFASQRAKRYGIVQDEMADLFFLILITSIIGARLLYVILNFNEFSSDPFSVFKIWNGGLVFYGGFIVALLSAFIFVKKKKLPLGKTADIIAPAIALGHAIGRIGCFFAGCCYGQQCDLPWAVTFEDPASLAPLHVALHPTQLYEVVANFTLFFILLSVDKKKKIDGIIFWFYIFFYGLLRAFIETFRGDPRGDFILNSLSVSQGIGISMSIAGLCMIVRLLMLHKPAIKNNPAIKNKTVKGHGKNAGN
ncbi:MAG: prolipoprotein diacylglyceryl transferase [Desulfamplus sp.]|nr:prolipoprotein diacylglyceryl transferase [Desulfamplus sp.]